MHTHSCKIQVANRQIAVRGLVLSVDGDNVVARIDVHFHSRYIFGMYLPGAEVLSTRLPGHIPHCYTFLQCMERTAILETQQCCGNGVFPASSSNRGLDKRLCTRHS